MIPGIPEPAAFLAFTLFHGVGLALAVEFIVIRRVKNRPSKNRNRRAV